MSFLILGLLLAQVCAGAGGNQQNWRYLELCPSQVSDLENIKIKLSLTKNCLGCDTSLQSANSRWIYVFQFQLHQ